MTVIIDIVIVITRILFFLNVFQSDFEVIPGENSAIVFAEGRMEGVAGKYENEYALKYVLNKDGKVTVLKEYLSDLLLAQKLYGQGLCGEKMNE